MNVDGKDKIDNTSYENVHSLVTSSASDAQEGGLSNIEPNKLCTVEPCTTLVSHTCPEIPYSSCGTESKNSVSSLHSVVQHNISFAF